MTEWDAKTYDRLAAPQEEWAREVLDRLTGFGERIELLHADLIELELPARLRRPARLRHRVARR